jgi:hypothetical protein
MFSCREELPELPDEYYDNYANVVRKNGEISALLPWEFGKAVTAGFQMWLP